MPDVTLEQATAIIERGRAHAAEMGLNAVFSILDRGANPVAFARMDDAWLASNDLAVAKARTAVMFRMPSEDLAAPVAVGEPYPHFDHVPGGGLILMGGGLPLVDGEGRLLGGLGVSGGTPDQDAALARVARGD
ncbi:heme-binding protein [Tsukamurella sp. 1534]|uniref:GlcG/HbpS family heme-binding protein n=1 Tax=Tsukamurella sp. 1534 TaxID=1151061 RepID=UPI0002D46C2F|nr:heme-binding protein [Tsukamurella sp. 1534]